MTTKSILNQLWLIQSLYLIGSVEQNLWFRAVTENRKYSDHIPYTSISGIVFQWSQIRHFFLWAFFPARLAAGTAGWAESQQEFTGKLTSFGADVTNSVAVRGRRAIKLHWSAPVVGGWRKKWWRREVKGFPEPDTQCMCNQKCDPQHPWVMFFGKECSPAHELAFIHKGLQPQNPTAKFFTAFFFSGPGFGSSCLLAPALPWIMITLFRLLSPRVQAPPSADLKTIKKVVYKPISNSSRETKPTTGKKKKKKKGYQALSMLTIKYPTG